MRIRTALLAAAVVLGSAARVYVAVGKPLWADEIFTLNLARQPVPRILAALRADSGPPLHYLLARVLLSPFGARPGPEDGLVRAFSLVASLLHIPLFFRLTRRLGTPEIGLTAAALFSLMPLAVNYAAEGRAYALASLLVLFSFDRALALRESPRFGAAASLATGAAAATLTHYLAAFPLAGLGLLLPGASSRGRRALALSGGAAALLVSPWAFVALRQPRASMAWVLSPGFAQAPRQFFVNLAFGLQPPDGALAVCVPAALVFLAALLLLSRNGPLRPVTLVLAAGLVLLGIGQIATGAVVLPERAALPFLPFVVLLAAGAPRLLGLGSGAISLAGLAVGLPAMVAPSPGQELARLLVPAVSRGDKVCAVGLWGPELDYRLQRNGLPDRVVFFPPQVAAHPGWYDEKTLSADSLTNEAKALVLSPARPSIWVLPRGSKATAALVPLLNKLPATRLMSSPLIEVVKIRRGS